MERAFGIDPHCLRVRVMIFLAANPAVSGATVRKEFPQEIEARIYRVIRSLRDDNLILTGQRIGRDFTITITRQGRLWLYEESANMRALAEKSLDAFHVAEMHT